MKEPRVQSPLKWRMMYRLISYIPSNDIYVCKTLEQALCDTLMPPTPVYSQVLALCVHYQYDARTLLQTGLVSKAQQATCSAHVCQQLPRLLTTAHREVILRSQANKYEATELAAYLRPLQWLYQSAGPAAVDSPAVAEALLGLSPENPSELQAQRAQIAAMYGVRVTSELIVSASRRRLCNPEMWVRAHLPDGWEEYQVHVPPGTPLPAYVYEMMLGSCQVCMHLHQVLCKARHSCNQ